jgi:hypothetical protein
VSRLRFKGPIQPRPPGQTLTRTSIFQIKFYQGADPTTPMHSISAFFATLILVFIVQCGEPNPPPLAQPSSNNDPSHVTDPCEKPGKIATAPGTIHVNDPAKSGRKYGTHFLADDKGNIIWMLQSSRVDLSSCVGSVSPYELEGMQSAEHPDLFIVCKLLYPVFGSIQNATFRAQRDCIRISCRTWF